MSSAVQLLTKVVTVLVIVYAAGSAWMSIRQTEISAATEGFAVGHRLAAADLPLPTARRSFVAAVSKECEACDINAQFYRDLLRAGLDAAAYPVLIVNSSVYAAHAFAEAHGLDFKDVRSAAFDRLGIREVPTTALISPGGSIEARWIGSLTISDQEAILRTLGLTRPEPVPFQPPVTTISKIANSYSMLAPDTLADALKSQNPPVLLDVRTREEFEKRHIAGAVNIPFDELEVRAQREVAAGWTLAVYCGVPPNCPTDGGAPGSYPVIECTAGRRVLATLGYMDVSIVQGDLSSLQRAGVPLAALQ